MDVEHIEALDDPARPWRKIWRCGDVWVKTYARRREGEKLGTITYAVTASACDENGANAGASILGGSEKPRERLVQFKSDGPLEEPMNVTMDNVTTTMVKMVARAVINERVTQEMRL